MMLGRARYYAGVVKRRLVYWLLKIYPKFWYTRKYYREDCGGFEHFKSGAEELDKFYIVLRMASLAKGMRVLDIGCGRGEFCRLLKEQGCIPSGIDFSAHAVEIARENFADLEFIRADALKYRPEAGLARVFMVDFIEHVNRSYFAKVLLKCLQWLEDEGYIVIHTPEKTQESCQRIPFHPEHINLMTAKELHVCLEKNGFKVNNLLIFPRYSPGYAGGMFCVAQKKTQESRQKGGKKTLIRYHAALGDTVCLTAAIRAYKNKYPEEKLYVSSFSPELFYYNKHIEYPLEWIPGKFFTKVFELEWKPLPERRKRHIVDNLALQMGLDDFSANQRKPEIFICQYEQEIFDHKFMVPDSHPLVVLSPFSRWPSRNWSDNRWRAVGRYITQKYGVDIIQVGMADESYLGIGNNWLGLTNARMLAILLSKARLLLSVDTGIPHLAAAFNKPSIVLFGPMNPDLVGYDGITHPIIASGGCRGCYQDTSWHQDNPPHLCPKGTYECMRNISVEQVIESIDRLMR